MSLLYLYRWIHQKLKARKGLAIADTPADVEKENVAVEPAPKGDFMRGKSMIAQVNEGGNDVESFFSRFCPLHWDALQKVTRVGAFVLKTLLMKYWFSKLLNYLPILPLVRAVPRAINSHAFRSRVCEGVSRGVQIKLK